MPTFMPRFLPNSSGIGPYAQMGACHGCKEAFDWKQGTMALRYATCPRCGGPLRATTSLQRRFGSFQPIAYERISA